MELAPIQHASQRVLTTLQIAEAYGVESKSLMRNFQRNKERFTEGVHFYALTGDELKSFKGERQNDATLKFVSVLYLWTEQGAFLLAKSLNTDKAWQAYSLLVEQYYKVTRELSVAGQAQSALPFDEARLIALETEIHEIKELLKFMTLHSGEQKRVQRAVGERVYQLSQKAVDRPNLFRELYSALKVRYNVSSYRDIKQHELQDALRFIYAWEGSKRHEKRA